MLVVEYVQTMLNETRDMTRIGSDKRRLGVPYTRVPEIPVRAAGAAPDDALAVFVSELDVAARRP